MSVPFCAKCCNKVLEMKVSASGLKYGVLVGCKECPDIHNYQDAEKLCPILSDTERESVESAIKRQHGGMVR